MEEIAKSVTIYISHAVETLAAIIIGVAVIQVLIRFMQAMHRHANKLCKEEIRLQFGSSVAVALELLLGADVLATAVAPSWDDIGKLAAIAIIRTVLNFFLEKELQKMHRMEENGKHVMNGKRIEELQMH